MSTRTGKAHTDSKTAAWKKDFLLLAAGAARACREQIARLNTSKTKSFHGMPMRVELECYYRKPKGAAWFCTNAIDNDNAEKNVWDAMQGVFFQNDNRIISNETFKAWSEGAPFLKARVVGLKEKKTCVD